MAPSNGTTSTAPCNVQSAKVVRRPPPLLEVRTPIAIAIWGISNLSIHSTTKKNQTVMEAIPSFKPLFRTHNTYGAKISEKSAQRVSHKASAPPVQSANQRAFVGNPLRVFPDPSPLQKYQRHHKSVAPALNTNAPVPLRHSMNALCDLLG